MVCFNTYNVSQSKVAPERKKSAAHPKRPIQISEQLHSLVTMMARDDNLSLEQIVSAAVVSKAKKRLSTPDLDRQTSYYRMIKEAENEIKNRYHGERTRRSLQMRRINSERRKKKIAPHPSDSFGLERIRYTIPNYYKYPVEYKYGIPIPKPPPSSYPTYYPHS